MFSIWLCSFQGTSGLLRSLKTIQAKEEYTVIRPAFAGFLGSSPLQPLGCPQIRSIPLAPLYRPGMNDPVPLLVLSLERR